MFRVFLSPLRGNQCDASWARVGSSLPVLRVLPLLSSRVCALLYLQKGELNPS